MTWILVALLAYLLLAISNIFDKFLVDNVVTSSRVYVFIVCLLGILVLFAAPWFLHWPGIYWLIVDLLSGGVFALALWSLYEALRRGEASQTIVFIGGLTPIFSLIFSILFFKEHFSASEWVGIGLLLVGIFIIALLPKHRHVFTRIMKKLNLANNSQSGSLIFALGSSLAYAIYFLATKYSYSAQPFVSTFMWNRIGAAIFVLFFLIRARDRAAILNAFKRPRHTRHKGLVFFNQLIGSSGFLLQNYAIFLGSVVLVNALQGAQYAFILIISSILAAMSPKLLKENFSKKIFLQKLMAVFIIGLGLYFIMI